MTTKKIEDYDFTVETVQVEAKARKLKVNWPNFAPVKDPEPQVKTKNNE